MSREERMRKELTYDDAIALQSLPAVELSVPFLDITNNFFGGKLMVSGGGKTSAQVALQGTLPEFEKAGTGNLEGRFFTQTENDTNQEVCVVGSKVADDFFKLGSRGPNIKIGTQEFRVVGVLEKREQFLIGGGSDDQNNVIYVPFTVAQKLKPNADDIYILAVARRADGRGKGSGARHAARRRQVPFAANDNFGMETSESILDNFPSITAGLAIAMVVISSLA